MADCRQWDALITIRLTINEGGVPRNVSTSTNTIILVPPRGAPLVRPAVFFTTGADGVVQYVVQPGEISLPGSWYVQARCVFPSGLDVRSTRVALNVEPSPAG